MANNRFQVETDFYELLTRAEEQCRLRTLADLKELPVTVSDSLAYQIKLLESLYRFSSCYWGCRGQEHIFENLSGRCGVCLR